MLESEHSIGNQWFEITVGNDVFVSQFVDCSKHCKSASLEEVLQGSVPGIVHYKWRTGEVTCSKSAKAISLMLEEAIAIWAESESSSVSNTSNGDKICAVSGAVLIVANVQYEVGGSVDHIPVEVAQIDLAVGVQQVVDEAHVGLKDGRHIVRCGDGTE